MNRKPITECSPQANSAFDASYSGLPEYLPDENIKTTQEACAADKQPYYFPNLNQTMTEIRLQEAVQTDLPEIVAIYNSTIAARSSTADLTPVSVADRQAWFDAHGGNRPLYVVKNDNGEVIGWGSFSDYYPREAYRITAEISLYIRADQRG
ncbi:MAG: GNAT family N-acetyltransferase, partial [Neisseria sp.]|nr:GNAT family N-acetyltransferase [Neisseria sp.]